MNERSPFLLLALNVVLFLVGTASISLLIYQQLPRLASFQDAVMLSDDLAVAYNPSFCSLALIQKQTLQTTRSEKEIWQRLLASWRRGRSRIYGHGDEAEFQMSMGSPLSIASRASFANGLPFNTVSVLNRITVKIPQEFCYLLPGRRTES